MSSYIRLTDATKFVDRTIILAIDHISQILKEQSNDSVEIIMTNQYNYYVKESIEQIEDAIIRSHYQDTVITKSETQKSSEKIDEPINNKPPIPQNESRHIQNKSKFHGRTVR